MKMIGIVGAMPMEISALEEQLGCRKVICKAGLRFNVGTLNGRSVVLVCCGIGKVNAALSAQILLDDFGVDFILNIGCAGAICKDLHPGDVVLSKKTVDWSMDLSPLGYVRGVVPGMPLFWQASEELERGFLLAAQSMGMRNRVYSGVVATGDSFVNDPYVRSLLEREFHALCVDMEGSAVGQVSQLNEIGFLVIRVISDDAGEEASEVYQENKGKVNWSLQEFIFGALAYL